MYISHTIPSQYGRGLIDHPCSLVIPVDPHACLDFARRQDRAADALLAAGRFEQAEKLSHAALEARARATGCRA